MNAGEASPLFLFLAVLDIFQILWAVWISGRWGVATVKLAYGSVRPWKWRGNRDPWRGRVAHWMVSKALLFLAMAVAVGLSAAFGILYPEPHQNMLPAWAWWTTVATNIFGQVILVYFTIAHTRAYWMWKTLPADRRVGDTARVR